MLGERCGSFVLCEEKPLEAEKPLKNESLWTCREPRQGGKPFQDKEEALMVTRIKELMKKAQKIAQKFV